ncbi:MAG TPA: HlyD family efflux transporter periplasmic adaptor subunit [Terriglobales bacterium]|nr:HlyD family efflux transporter periplasmic adaptor subunit [Terriglobales bacterium]
MAGPILKDLLEAPATGHAEPPAQLQVVPAPPKRRRITLLVVLILGIVTIAALLIWQGLKPSRNQTNVQVAVTTVKRTDFVRSIRLHGTVEAINFLAIAPPRLSGPGMGSLVITKLAPSGSHVSKGNLLVQFDQQQQIKNALDQEATYVDLVEQINKKKADQATARAADESGLRQAENDMNSAAAEVRRNEILSKIDAEKNNLAFEQAKATYAQLRKTFDLKRQAAQAEVKSLEIQRDRAKAAMEYARKNTARLEIHAPIDGIVVLNSVWKGGQMGEVQEGDEVRAGVPFMQIVNPGTMQVRARVNQADVSLLRVGQPVRVGLDAYPDLSFTGKVERIAAIGVTSGLSDRVRSFNVLFSISGSDGRLMPDLSASLDIELQRLPNVLTVPRASLISSGDDHYVMAEDGSTYEKKPVQIGGEDDTVVVVSGIPEGSKVLSNVSR